MGRETTTFSFLGRNDMPRSKALECKLERSILPPLSPKGSGPLRGLRLGKMKAPALHFSPDAKAVK
jgi:hypothetical protein